jgi:hypothetical protein
MQVFDKGTGTYVVQYAQTSEALSHLLRGRLCETLHSMKLFYIWHTSEGVATVISTHTVENGYSSSENM